MPSDPELAEVWARGKLRDLEIEYQMKAHPYLQMLIRIEKIRMLQRPIMVRIDGEME